MTIRTIQSKLMIAGFYKGALDGIWGPQSDAALDKALGLDKEVAIAWGRKVDSMFREKVIQVAARIGAPVNDLMACMAWETGRTFDPAIKNMAGSGATGLIQFMPATARGLGTTVEDLARMTAVRQLDYVEAYFRPFRGRLHNLGDLYMAILWPAGIGKPDSFVLWDKDRRPTTYRQNAGIDINRDGKITRGEAMTKVGGMLAEGLLPENRWDVSR